MKTKHIWLKIGVIVSFISIYFCGCDLVPRVKLEKTSFSFTFPDSSKNGLSRVLDMDQDPFGNYYVVDSKDQRVYKFDSSGVLIDTVIHSGSGYGSVWRPVSINAYDSLLVLFNINTLEYFKNGKLQRKLLPSGRAEILIDKDGTIVLNRGSDSYQHKYLMQVRDENGQKISEFGTPRQPLFPDLNPDLAFMGLLPQQRIVYVPAFLDSMFLYSYQGELLKADQLKQTYQKNKSSADSLYLEIEDLDTWQDQIYIVRIDQDKTDDETVYVDRIEEYNSDLDLVRIYTLPESIATSVALEPWSMLYHRFLVTKDKFIFMVSKPYEHVEAYTPRIDK